MLEKSNDLKLYEMSDAIMHRFRDSVAEARETARVAKVAAVFVIDGTTYYAMPDGEIVREDSTLGE